jgi:hypothetical protein
MTKPRGFVVWEGPSALDGSPIVLIATRGTKGKANSKTGSMVQTYILNRNLDPVRAAQQGRDKGICGDCPHKLSEQGTCYVRLDTGPLNVFKAYKRGTYARCFNSSVVGVQLAGELVRMGAYGDPCAVPIEVWQGLLRYAKGHTGYTHQWRQDRFQEFASLCMASCDNTPEDELARARGWRTFTIVTHEQFDTRHSLPVVRGSFLCPASAEGGKKLTCSQCLACDGNASGRGATVYIPVHGASYKQKRFDQLITIGG